MADIFQSIFAIFLCVLFIGSALNDGGNVK